MSGKDILLSVEGVSRVFGGSCGRGWGVLPTRPFPAISDVNLSVFRGETLALVGESGSGKSTLARIIVGLDRPTSGRVMFEGIDLTRLSRRAIAPLRRRFQMVFQDPGSSLDPRMTVEEILREPLAIHGESEVTGEGGARSALDQVVDQVALPRSMLDRYPHEMSGGQRQRVAIARALVLAPSLVVLDEPLTALDAVAQLQVLDLLRTLRTDRGLTYVIVSHDLGTIFRLADRVAVLHRGRLVELEDAPVLFRAPKHPHSKALLAAALRLSSALTTLRTPERT